MAARIAEDLAALYPQHAETFRANAAEFKTKLDTLDAHLREKLAGLEGKPFMVFHDAYQYFEKRYGLQGAGAIAIDPHEPSSIGHIQSVKAHMAEENIECVFTEPQFSDRLVKTVAEGLEVRTGMLDPLGAYLDEDKNAYISLLENMGETFAACLANTERETKDTRP
jgi:zinc transport system substrate-binding protein